MEWIEPYKLSDIPMTFDGAWWISHEDVVLMLNKTGHILLLKKSLFQTIPDKKVGEDLALKLIQRGFGHMNGDPQENCFCDEFQIQPFYFMIDFTNRCNMACLYCLRECDRQKSQEKIIDYDMLTKISHYLENYCKTYKISRISVQPWGGEPLMEKDKIFFLQDELRKRDIDADFTIESNGILLTRELMEELNRRKIHISISIDGNRSIHDAQRALLNGNPSHELVEKAVKTIYETNRENTAVLATITRKSASRVDEILEYFAVKLRIQRVKLNFVHQSSFVDNEKLCLTGEEIGDCSVKILHKILELRDRGYEIYDYNICTKLNNLLLDTKTDVCLCRGCSGGKKMVTIDCNGDIYPCDISDYPEEKLGNIMDNQDLIELIKKSTDRKPYFMPKTSQSCQKCPWQYYCRGGCTVHVKCAEKALGEIDEIECAVNRALYPELMELIIRNPEKVNHLTGTEIL